MYWTRLEVTALTTLLVASIGAASPGAAPIHPRPVFQQGNDVIIKIAFRLRPRSNIPNTPQLPPDIYMSILFALSCS
jgi:hypothetical protein